MEKSLTKTTERNTVSSDSDDPHWETEGNPKDLCVNFYSSNRDFQITPRENLHSFRCDSSPSSTTRPSNVDTAVGWDTPGTSTLPGNLNKVYSDSSVWKHRAVIGQ